MGSRLLLASLLATAALLGACGGDDSSGSSDGRPPQQVVDSGNAAKGKDVFGQNCAACHGGDGGGGTGPKLAGVSEYANPDVVVEQVREGGGGMPAFGDRLSEQELADVSAYVVKDLAAK
ncbi:MAG TPA: cytochrome c [Solirubrobacteraceae bacterium]|jgi:cytochrome c551